MSIKHLYVHVPFCKTICSYCDFCHRVYSKDLVDKWLKTIEKEIKEKCSDQYETIYIGGGTPTSLSDDELDKLLSFIEPFSKKVIEYTIEVNPESLDINKINIFNKYHINRISMGVESSSLKLLKLMNRHHTFIDVIEKVKLLKENGLNNISIDLMYSLPTQTIEDLKMTLDDFMKLDVPHVSLYSLTIEENSAFNKLHYNHLDEDTEADMYELINAYLRNNGYRQYEVSNFAKEGYESKHNLGYWNYDDFLGISLGSSSKIENNRYSITRDFNSYFNDYNTKDEDIVLSKNDMAFENIMMSLRTIYGLNINEFNKKYDMNLLNDFKKGVMNKNIIIKDDHLICTNLEVLNSVLIDFMD